MRWSTADGSRPARRLLVLGAAGGVGIAAVEIGKALGARVIAAVSSEEKAEPRGEAGADEAIVYPRGPSTATARRRSPPASRTRSDPAGADVILDPVGGDYTEAALRSIGWEGRFLVVGFPAGIAKLPLNLTLLKSCDVCGVFWGAFAARDPQANAAHVEQLFRWWDEGKIAPKISATYPLERAGDAIAALRDRKRGRQAGGHALKLAEWRASRARARDLLGGGDIRLRHGGRAAPARGAGRAQ